MSRKRVTSMEVLQYVFSKAQDLAYVVTGDRVSMSIDGVAPMDINKCFVVLRHTSGRSGDVQEGVVTVLIYSQPIFSQKDGRKMPDTQHVSKIERRAQDWVESLPTGEYLFWSDDTVQTDYDPEAGLYFTSIRLKYRHY